MPADLRTGRVPGRDLCHRRRVPKLGSALPLDGLSEEAKPVVTPDQLGDFGSTARARARARARVSGGACGHADEPEDRRPDPGLFREHVRRERCELFGTELRFHERQDVGLLLVTRVHLE
jgi:hypothetical protein